MNENLSDVVKSECDVSSDLNASSDNNEMGVTDDYDSEADDARSSQKSLPHKKRIPNKLKRALTSTPTRNIHAKCYKCTKCGEQFPNQATFNVSIDGNFFILKYLVKINTLHTRTRYN